MKRDNWGGGSNGGTFGVVTQRHAMLLWLDRTPMLKLQRYLGTCLMPAAH